MKQSFKALCIELVILVLVTLLSGKLTLAQDQPHMKVNVSQQDLQDKVVYSYQVVNDNEQAAAIVTLMIGYDFNEGTAELVTPPLNWDFFSGIPEGSATSPAGWQVSVITTEESEYLSVEWDTNESAYEIMPGQVLSGFSVVLPQKDDLYRTTHWSVILNDGTVISAPLESVDSVAKLIPIFKRTSSYA